MFLSINKRYCVEKNRLSVNNEKKQIKQKNIDIKTKKP